MAANLSHQPHQSKSIFSQDITLNTMLRNDMSPVSNKWHDMRMYINDHFKRTTDPFIYEFCDITKLCIADEIMVPVDVLEYNEQCQRDYVPKRMERMKEIGKECGGNPVTGHHKLFFNPPILVKDKKTGKLYVLDGRHRIMLFTSDDCFMLNGKFWILCRWGGVQDDQQQSNMFLNVGQATTPLKVSEKFLLNVKRGDKATVTLIQIASKHGFAITTQNLGRTVAYSNDPDHEYRDVSCIYFLTKIVERSLNNDPKNANIAVPNKRDFTKTNLLLERIFGVMACFKYKHFNATSAGMIRGIAYFLHHVDNNKKPNQGCSAYSDDILMAAMDKMKIRKNAESFFKKACNVKGKANQYYLVAETITDWYNKEAGEDGSISVPPDPRNKKLN